ncbi:MAG TPA: segregation/condensation protein A [Verrucomicrobiae bacterium]|jgi:segregation and condensation protein A|nr:segregation/condensation protein A [Verrucomicrobiae bacterium]
MFPVSCSHVPIANPLAPAYDLFVPRPRIRAEDMAEYKVKFEVFEGPLDLLLYLIKKEEVDIYQVNLTKLATQFIEYIDTMRLLDLEIAGEFLVMASTLMYIKSRELLPVEQQVQVEGDEEGEDPRWELIRQLVEYKKFKDAAAQLQTLEVARENTFPRLPIKPDFEADRPVAKPEVSIFDLLNAVNTVLQRFTKRDDLRDIFEDKWTVSEKIEHVMKAITERGRVTFSELFAQAASRSEVVCTFLALLELIRLKQLVCAQPEPFAEIEVTRSQTAGQASALPPSEPAAAESSDAGSNPVAPESAPARETSDASTPEVGGNPA